jgi:hypothetical protein
MPTILVFTAIGLLLGMRHATDPDHVIAVATIVSRERTMLRAMIVGILWGIGHTVTIVAVGSALVLFKYTIPPRMGLAMELAVAFMLILLGALNLSGLMDRAIEWLAIRGYIPGAHTHEISGRIVLHGHDEYGSDASRSLRMPAWCRQLGLFHVIRPLAVGIVHGVAGSAAVTLLVLATITQPGWAMLYLALFGIGTIVGMLVITAALAVPFTCTLARYSRFNHSLVIASGVISVTFGVFLCYQAVVTDGLLSHNPIWSPR